MLVRDAELACAQQDNMSMATSEQAESRRRKAMTNVYDVLNLVRGLRAELRKRLEEALEAGCEINDVGALYHFIDLLGD